MKETYLTILFVLIVHLASYGQLKVIPYDFAEGRYNLAGDAVIGDYYRTALHTVITFSKNYVEITIGSKVKSYYWVKGTKELHNNLGDGIEYTCLDKDFNSVICTILFELRQTTSVIYYPAVNELKIYRSKTIRVQ